MEGWTTERLEDCLETLIDYRGKSPTKALSGIPVLSAKVVKTSGLVRPIEQTIAVDYYAKWMTRGLPHPGDIVMTTEAPMGEVIQLDAETAQFALGQRIVCLRGKRGKIDNTFLRYLLISSEQQKLLASYATGTTVLGISQKALRSVPISYPTYSEQVQLGELLSAFDDKIELNRRMNETLETSAQALFRDWFVDFGPTRAKAEGRPAYLAPDLWSLFPGQLGVDGVPEGWSVYALGDLADQHTRSIDPAKSGDAVFEHYSLPAFDNGASPSLDRGDEIKSNKTLVPAGAVLLSKLNPEISRVWMPTLAKDAKQVASTEFLTFVPKAPAGRSLLFAMFRERVASPLMKQMLANRIASRSLAGTRDALLPGLMSGKIRVADARSQASTSL
jgi:type I restriction enzyme S subunit